jgi:cathepsin D
MGSPATGPNSVTVDEDGNDFSYFFSMEFGSSNESLWILFDTGGTNTWVFGSNCTVEACELHNTFGQDNSTTLEMSDDTFSVGYGSGTVSGLLGTDTVSIANFSLELTFGLANNASSDFEDYPMDGILGLGRSNSTTIGTSTAMETIAKDNILPSNIVAVSLQRAIDNTTDGELTFGGVDPTKFEGDILYTSTSTDTDRWEIPVDDAAVGGTPLNFTGKSAIIDTGTTYIFLPPNDASALHALIPGSTAASDEFVIPCSTNTTVQFTFSGVSYSVSPQDYVGTATNSSGTSCYSNIIGVQTFGSDDWLLGDTFMKNVYSVFDFDQNRIGFAFRNGTASSTNTSSGSASSSSATTGTSTGSSSSATQTVSTTQSGSTSGSVTSLALPSLANIATLASSLGLYFVFSI